MEKQDISLPLEVKLTEIDYVMLNSQVIAPFCVSWSQDYKLLIKAEGGVYVFELWPTPLSEQPSITFLKSWIPASSFMPLTNAVIEHKNNAFLWNQKKQYVYEIALDSTLSGIVQKPNCTLAFSQFIQCEFSPLINKTSYISCLTNNGLLEIYKNKFNKWLPIINITSLWIAYCSAPNNLNKIDFIYYKSKMFELKINAMKWCEKPELIFLTCHDNGGIVVWNVEVKHDILKMNVRHCLNVNGKPCCLELCPAFQSQFCLLFFGKLSGIVSCLVINLTSKETIQNFCLWKNKDLFSPSLFKIKCINENLIIFIVKRHILLIQNLSINTSKKYEVVQTNWQEFPSAIISLNEYQDVLIACLQNHDLYILNVKDSKSVKLTKIDMGIKLKHKISHHCYGFAISQNKAIWILISSPKVNYDSLKEITHLIFFSPEIKTFHSLTDVSSSGLIEKIVKEFKETRLYDIFDLLELKKLELLLNISKFKKSYKVNKNFTILELQLILWELKLKLCSNFADINTAIAEVEYLIACKRAENILSNTVNLGIVSDLQKKSLDICQALVKEKVENKAVCGTCCICRSEIFSEEVRMFTCTNSHKIPRCCLSLLPCDEIPYAICKNCNSVALLSFVTESDSHCIYCDGFLEFNSRL